MKRILEPWRLCEHLVFIRDLDMNPVQLLPNYVSNSRQWSSLILRFLMYKGDSPPRTVLSSWWWESALPLSHTALNKILQMKVLASCQLHLKPLINVGN